MTAPGRILLASIPVLISIYASRWKARDEAAAFKNRPSNLNLPVKETYDFIIVGAGTAGCILANRLSKKFSVLLLDSGGNPPPLIDVPFLRETIQADPAVNFIFRTKPMEKAALERDGILTITAGKMLGGSGSHNGVQWERGHAYDFDRWANVTRDESWKYENVLKYFKKIENYHGKFSNSHYHGESGSVHIVDGGSFPGSNVWFAAGQELGYKLSNSNWPQTVGFSSLSYSKLSGRRVSSYTAYLKPILKKRRKKLRLYRYSPVSHVIFDGKTAVGVQYKRHGVSRAAFARKEVILSAGVYWSPIILFRSGIGPKDQVEAAKAQTHIVTLPVGKNFHDHAGVGLPPIHLNDARLSWSIENNLTFRDISNFVKHGKGPLTGNHVEAEAFIMSSRAKEEILRMGNQKTDFSDWPDIQIYYNSTGPLSSSVTCGVCHGRPLSTGTVTINSSALEIDGNDVPILDHNLLDKDSDVEVLLEGINFALKVLEKTRAFQQVGARLMDGPYEPCKKHAFRSKDYWRCYIRHKTGTGYHGVGSCAMGYGKSDPKAVLDSKLRVLGVKNLRVVDASVMPYITNANVCAPVMMIAEKAADDILTKYFHPKDWFRVYKIRVATIFGTTYFFHVANFMWKIKIHMWQKLILV